MGCANSGIYRLHIMVDNDSDQWKEDILNHIKEKYIPEKISNGVELYSGGVDARSFRLGFNTAKDMIINYLEEII